MGNYETSFVTDDSGTLFSVGCLEDFEAMIKREFVAQDDTHHLPSGEWCRWEDVEPIMAERDSLAKFAEVRRVQINELMDALKQIAEIIPETAPEAWMVQTAKDAIGEQL